MLKRLGLWHSLKKLGRVISPLTKVLEEQAEHNKLVLQQTLQSRWNNQMQSLSEEREKAHWEQQALKTTTCLSKVEVHNNSELVLLQLLHGAVRSMMRSHGVDKERYEKAFVDVRNSMYAINDYNERMDDE